MSKIFFTLYFSCCAFLLFGQYDCSKLKSAKKNTKSNSLSIAQIAETEKYDVHFYSLDVSLNNLVPDIIGTVEIHATSRIALDSALFELFQTMNITQIRLNGAPTPYSRNVSAVKVPLNVPENTSFVLSIDYNGVPPNSGANPMGGSGLTSMIEEGYDFKVTASLSEPFSAYEWWPCKQSLTDKADSCAVKITVPNNCKAGSAGMLENVVDLGNGFSRYEWKHRHPIDYYLISVAVAEYFEYNIYANLEGAPNPVLIQNYIYDSPQVIIDWKKDIDQTVDYMQLFSKLFGVYPYHDEKYGHCMAPIGGGMEHQTMTTMVHFWKNLNAHELAHQWFGNNVTCASWADIWVNEGFATYLSYLMLENIHPEERAQEMQNYHNSAMQYLDGSVYVYTDTLSSQRLFDSRLTYKKGAAIINTMRFIINDDEKFFQGLKDFQTDFAGGTATGLDVKKSLENASGVDLTECFEQWYYGQGHPTYSLKWNEIGHDLSLEIKQYPSGAFITQLFTNPLEISFERDNQSDTTIRFEVPAKTNTYFIPNVGRIKKVKEIDPYNWIINKEDTIIYDHSFEVPPTNGYVIPSVEVGPNPTDGKIEIVAQSPGSHTVKVIDSKGKYLMVKAFLKDTVIDVSSLAQGTYIFVITSEFGVTETTRIIKR